MRHSIAFIQVRRVVFTEIYFIDQLFWNLDWYFRHKYAHHAERSRPAIKDDERFQNRLVRDVKISMLNSVGKNCWQILDRSRTDFTMISFYRNKDTWFNLWFNIVRSSILFKFGYPNLIRQIKHRCNILAFTWIQVTLEYKHSYIG